MDAEGGAKTEIVVAVNGQTFYRGPNLLPDSPVPVGEGKWGRQGASGGAADDGQGLGQLLEPA